MHAPAVYHSFAFFSFEFEIGTAKYAEASSFAFQFEKGFISVRRTNPEYKIQNPSEL